MYKQIQETAFFTIERPCYINIDFCLAIAIASMLSIFYNSKIYKNDLVGKFSFFYNYMLYACILN